MLQQRQAMWLARHLRLSKVQHMLFRGQSLGYVIAWPPPFPSSIPAPPPPLRQPNSICCRTPSLVFPSHLYVFPVTCAATTQLACYSADSACIHYHSLQAQVGKPCSYDQLHDASLVMPSESLQDAFSLTTACGLLEPHTLCAHCGFVTSLEPHTLC